jgi:hypothetical protein
MKIRREKLLVELYTVLTMHNLPHKVSANSNGVQITAFVPKDAVTEGHLEDGVYLSDSPEGYDNSQGDWVSINAVIINICVKEDECGMWNFPESELEKIEKLGESLSNIMIHHDIKQRAIDSLFEKTKIYLGGVK